MHVAPRRRSNRIAINGNCRLLNCYMYLEDTDTGVNRILSDTST